MVGCSECPDISPVENVSTCTRCSQVEDLLHQVAKFQETVKRVCSITGFETEIGNWFQKHISVVDTTENETPWSRVIHNSSALLQSPPSSITIRYEALTAVDTHEQCLQGETVPAVDMTPSSTGKQEMPLGQNLAGAKYFQA